MKIESATEHRPRIAVLGLGRLGSSILARLHDREFHARGWSRSAGDDLQATVAGAEVIILALPDGRSCAEVLAQVGDTTRARIVNMSTIGPSEAGDLATRLGDRYTHAPVLGSMSAARNGTLRIIAGGDVTDVADVLESLGEIIHASDARTAAALKLVTNTSLAGSIIALRESLRQAHGLGVGRTLALDVLEQGPLGSLVARKRRYLEASSAPAEFTREMLLKDVLLAVDESGVPSHLLAELMVSCEPISDDFARAALENPVDSGVLAPLYAYMEGHATGEPERFRAAFLPSAHIEGLRDGSFVTWTLEQYLALFSGSPARDEATRERRIDAVHVRGTVATASMTLRHGSDVFTDVFLLVHVDEGWRIANKAYHRESVSQLASST